MVSTIIRIHEILDRALGHAEAEVYWQGEEESLTPREAYDLLNPLRGHVRRVKIALSGFRHDDALEAIRAFCAAVAGTDLESRHCVEVLRLTEAYADFDVDEIDVILRETR